MSYGSGEGGEALLIVPVVLVIPAFSAYYFESNSRVGSEDVMSNTAKNYFTSSMAGLVTYRYLDGKPNSELIGLATWLVSTWAIPKLKEIEDTSIESSFYNAAYGFNSIGTTIELGYKDYKGLIGFGSFGDHTVGSKHSILSNWSRVVAFRREFNLTEKNIISPEFSFRKSGVIASKDYKDVDSATLSTITPGIHYKYDIIGVFPIHALIGYDIPLNKQTSSFYQRNSFGMLDKINFGFGIGLKIK